MASPLASPASVVLGADLGVFAETKAVKAVMRTVFVFLFFVGGVVVGGLLIVCFCSFTYFVYVMVVGSGFV